MDDSAAKRAILEINGRLSEITGQPPATLRCTPEKVDADLLYVFGIVGGARTGKSTLMHGLSLDSGMHPDRRRANGTPAPWAYVFRGDLGDFESRPAQRTAPARVIAHDNPDLARRVFLDLPDPALDPKDHLAAWETDLSGVVWVVTDATYADRRLHDRLHSTYKDFANFSFVFNRIDHVLGRQGATAAVIRDELFQTLSDWLPGESLSRERVYAVCARAPDKHDLDRLRRDLFARPMSELMDGKRRNVRREVRVGARAIEAHYGLGARLDELRALLDHLPGVVDREAGSALAQVQDAAGRLERPLQAMVSALYEHRLRPWPILSLLVEPALRAAAAAHRWQRTRRPGEPADYPDLERLLARLDIEPRLRAVETRLRAEFPAFFATFSRLDAELAVPSASLAPVLQEGLERIDREALDRLKNEVYRPPGRRTRWLAVLPVLWFPFVQPLLEAGLAPADSAGGPSVLQAVAYLFVRLLGIAALAQTLALVALFYALLLIVLWLSTHRCVHKLRLEAGPYRTGLRDLVVARLGGPYRKLLGELDEQRRRLEEAAEGR